MSDPGHPSRRRSDAYVSVSVQVAQRVARGEAAEAIGVVRRELRRIAGLDDEEGRRFLYGMLAVCHGRAGDPEGVRLVLEEMEGELSECAEAALKIAEGYLLLLGEAPAARAWAVKARRLAGESVDGSPCERRARALSLEGRAALLEGDTAAALEALERSELPDPDLARELLGAGIPGEQLRELLRRGLAAHREQERRGIATTACSEEIRRLIERLERAGGDGG